MMLRKMIMLLACSATCCFGAWPTYHGGPSLNGFSELDVGEALKLEWRYNAGGEVYSTPVSDGERIYFAAKKGQVIAIDLKGSEVWKKRFTRTNDAGKEMALRFEAPLVCAAGLVLVGSTRGTLYALEAETGAEKWRYETGGIIIGSPNLIEQHTIIVLDQGEGALHGIDLKTGKRLWKSEGVERCDGVPGVGERHIAFGSCLAQLHVYSKDGKHLKDVDVGGDGQIAGGVAMYGQQAFAGARDGGLLCFDLEKGTIIWSSDESDDQTFSTPALSSDRVVYASDNGFVYAVDAKDGKLIWAFDTGGIPGSPVIAKEQVVVASDGILFLLKLKDGSRVWKSEISDDITSPALVNGMIVVGSDDGTVSAWSAQSP